jgi:hypothetical protein
MEITRMFLCCIRSQINKNLKEIPQWVSLKESPDVSAAVEEDLDESGDEARILCRQCGQIIGRPEDRIAVNGAHQHAFANPHGIIFEIACFQTVTGCGYVGETSTEFTWFPGYSWRIIICGNCLTHLGWLFSADGGHHFFGLVLDYIVSIE